MCVVYIYKFDKIYIIACGLFQSLFSNKHNLQVQVHNFSK